MPRAIDIVGRQWLSLFISMATGPLISDRIKAWFLSPTVTGGIHRTLTDIVENNPNGYSISLPELEATYGSSTVASGEILQEIAVRIADPCADLVSNIVGHIVGWLVPLLFFGYLKKKLEFIKDLKAREYSSLSVREKKRARFFVGIEHFLGFVAGSAVGMFVAVAVSVFVLTVFQVVVVYDAHSPVMSIYENSHVFKFINEINIWGMIKQLWS